MKVRITSPGVYDRHDAEVRFTATIDRTATPITVTAYALFIIGEALGFPPSEPLVLYAAGGKLLEAVVASSVLAQGELQPMYLISHDDVLRVTGRSGEGNSHVPNRWKN